MYTRAGYEATAIAEAEVLVRLQEGPVWVAQFAETIVGTMSVVPKPDSLYIRGMAAHPTARGQQVGLRLLLKAEQHARKERLARLFLSTTPFLDRAIRLYEQFGFRRSTDGPHNLFGTPLFTMEKWLPPQ